MLMKFRTSGFKLFDQTIELNMMCNKGENSMEVKKAHLLKSAIIYGANNSGKSSFIEAISVMKDLYKEGSLEDFPFFQCKNFFDDDKPITFEIEFYINGFTYEYGIEVINNKTLAEHLSIDHKCAFSRGKNKEECTIDSKLFQESILLSSYDFLNSDELFASKARSYLEKISNVHIKNINQFFNKIIFFDNNRAGQFTDLIISCLEDNDMSKFYNNVIAKADISLKGKEMSSDIGIPGYKEEEIIKDLMADEEVDKDSINTIIKALKVKSIYHKDGKERKVPSNVFDSIGTKKFSNLLLLVMNIIESDEILLIDEIDNSLHYRLTRELIKIMNSKQNTGAQFIMSAHDVKLLTPLLFRKEQINFIERHEGNIDMFSLGDFPEIRNTSDYENLYMKNKVGALPRPDFEEIMKQWPKNASKERRVS